LILQELKQEQKYRDRCQNLKGLTIYLNLFFNCKRRQLLTNFQFTQPEQQIWYGVNCKVTTMDNGRLF